MTVLGVSSEEREVAVAGLEESAVRLAWGFATDTGHRRSHNEDSLVALAPVFAVADGMGGHAAGDVASDAVVRRLAKLAEGGMPVDPESIVAALQAATEDISFAMAEREDGGAGTTVTGAGLCESDGRAQWLLFNVGDSRAYLYDQGQLAQVTVDHSVVQELVTAGLISPADAELHPDSNVVTRAVGFNARPEPDFWLLPVTSGSRLLLCSDGLTREVDESEILRALSRELSAGEVAQALIDAALDAGGRDNISAIVIDIR